MSESDAEQLLSIYLRDHFAGATGGMELAKRLASENEGTDYGPRLSALAVEIEQDREALDAMLHRLDVQPNPGKIAGAWAAEKLGRLKLNGRLRGYSPLSRVLELEGLIMGVTGKLGLWRALIELSEAGEGRLERPALERLRERAEDQRNRLAELHAEASREALALSAPAPG